MGIDAGEVVALGDLAMTLIKFVVDLVGADKAKASLDLLQTQEADRLADEAERLKFGRSSADQP